MAPRCRLPVAKLVHDAVVGGTINGRGVLWVDVGATGADSVLAKIMEVVVNAQMRRPQVQKFADRISGIFVPVVIALALLTWSAWAVIVEQAHDLSSPTHPSPHLLSADAPCTRLLCAALS